MPAEALVEQAFLPVVGQAFLSVSSVEALAGTAGPTLVNMTAANGDLVLVDAADPAVKVLTLNRPDKRTRSASG